MVRRHARMAFGPGALVFPGGRVEPDDHDPAWAAHTLGWEKVPAPERAPRISALRETFEESGILLARSSDGRWSVDPSAAETRGDIAGGRREFLDLVRTLGLTLDLEAAAPFARWITPAHMSKRFDTHFYVAHGPDAQLAAADGWETVEAEWIAPAEALRLGETGERKLMFPTRLNLQLLQQSRDAASAVAAARKRVIVPVQPRLERRETGDVVVIPAEAGYGLTEAPASVLA